MAAQTKTALDLFTDYKHDHEHALEPCIDCLLRRAEALSQTEQETLRSLLEDYLLSSARPAYSPLQMRGLSAKVRPIVDKVMDSPMALAARDQHEAEWRDLSRLTRLRRRLCSLAYQYRSGLRGPMRVVRRLERKSWE